ncbi:MAG: FAD-binding oxidoreductase [Candidatus Binataceae bacterium]|jgi:sarcosine oxidase subunit beta
MGESADAVVIGGGIAGVNIAFQLASRGLRKVVLLEKTAIGAGASGKGAATVSAHFNGDIKMSLAHRALETWANFNDVYEVKERYYNPCGQIVLGAAEHAASMRSVIEMRRERGAETRLMSEQHLRELAPQISLNDIVAIAWEPDAGRIDALGATSAVAEAARKAGVQLRVGTAAREISVKNGRVDGVRTDAGVISSQLVFNAANVWAPRLLKPLRVYAPITPVRAQIGIFRRPGDYGPQRPLIIDLIQSIYMCDHPGDLMLAGRVARIDEERVSNLDDYPENADWSVIRSLRERVWRRFPAMRRSAFRGGYSGLNDMTPDLQPIVDQVPCADGLFVACGLSGSGFCYAPAIGQLLAEWALDGSPSIDIAALSLARFGSRSSDDLTTHLKMLLRAGCAE